MTENNNKRKHASTNASVAKSKQRRLSLVTIFSSAFFSVLMLFLIVIMLGVYRFVDFHSILSKLTNDALPKISLTGKTYSKVNELTYLTERLANSPSQAFRRIAYLDIEDKINQIMGLELEDENDEFLKTQLKAISREFHGLNSLIEKRIELQRLVKTLEQNMYQLHQKSLNNSISKNGDSNHEFDNFRWALNISEVIAISSKALANNRLSQVRQILSQLEKRLEKLLQDSKRIPTINMVNAEQLTRNLKHILISESGLLPTRIQELRSIGQATGRSNFVRNLVSDYARHVQFYSYELNHALIKETESTAIRVDQQTQIIAITAIFAIFFLVVVVFFLQRRIIRRLVRLNENVLLRLAGEDSNLNLNGNDEISDLAQSFNFFAEEIEQQKQKMQALSLTDGLTGIPNRRSLDQRLSAELKSAQRHKWSVSILVMDVDSFKAFNDHYGHLEGDDCLKQVAMTLAECQQRKSDFVARFGGEEFVFILPDTTTTGAERVAKDILDAISSLKIKHDWSSSTPYLSISIGIATFEFENPVVESVLLERADQALFLAKENGKNCFVSYGS